MDNSLLPKISASLSLDPATHSFASSQAPSLNLTVVSHHADPITIYADDLSPKLMLTCGALTITDMDPTTGSAVEVRQSIKTHCRIPPPTKAAVPLNEHLFYTLLPHTALTLSTPFTRHRTTGDKPLAKHDADYASDRTAKHGACGVDGLEPGHTYALSLASQPRVAWNVIRWWEYGTKEQVLYGGGDRDVVLLDGRQVRFGAGPHEPLVVDSTGVGVVQFECRAWGT